MRWLWLRLPECAAGQIESVNDIRPANYLRANSIRGHNADAVLVSDDSVPFHLTESSVDLRVRWNAMLSCIDRQQEHTEVDFDLLGEAAANHVPHVVDDLLVCHCHNGCLQQIAAKGLCYEKRR